MSHLGDAFMARRLDRKLTTGQLARLAGYRNLTRGANRIHGFEAGGTESTRREAPGHISLLRRRRS